MIDEIENEEIDELIEGDIKNNKIENQKKPLKDDEEQLMSGIDVDDDEADSDFDQHKNMMLKNEKQNNGQTDLRVRASSGSNNHV